LNGIKRDKFSKREMIKLMKYTYLLENDKIKNELELLYQKYSGFLEKAEEVWQELNEARSILFLTGQVYCEQIAIDAIERRLNLLKQPIQLSEFLHLVDSNSEKLSELRQDELFAKLEEFYKIIKEYKNKYSKGKFYLDEERFIEFYNKFNPNKDLKTGYKGEFDKKTLDFMK